MLPKRLSVKYFVDQPAKVDIDKLAPIFQRWIQQHAVEGLLIDVADYKHVPNGPGIMLIGHEGDYSLDLRDGRAGLLYVRKRDLTGEIQDALALVFRIALAACQQLESERALKGLRFDYTTPEIIFLDRLNYPNKPETLATIQDSVQAFANGLYGELRVEQVENDPREPFTMRMVAVGEFNAEALLDKLPLSVYGEGVGG